MKKKDTTIDQESFAEISEALAAMQSPDEVRVFLREICTPGECHDIALRWRLMKMLAAGIPQRKIAADLGVSLCKITRGSKYLKDKNSVFSHLLSEHINSEK